MHVLEIASQLGARPNSFVFDAVNDSVTQYRLDGLSRLLASWLNDDATTEQALEELHAVTELTMGALLGATWDDRSYAQQAKEMVARGLISREEHDVLIELKDRRRVVRHHLGAMPRAELEERLPGVLGAVHTIVSPLPI